MMYLRHRKSFGAAVALALSVSTLVGSSTMAATAAARPNAITPAAAGTPVFDFSPNQIAIPTDRSTWPAFREQAVQWRAQQIADLDYTGAPNAADTKWLNSTFLIAHTQLNDLTLLDTDTNQFTVDKFLDKAEEQHGGFDMLLLWHAHMNLGTDNRNQWDYFRDQPGGVEGLAAAIEKVHARGTKVALTYLPWDTGTRREESWTGDNAQNDMEMLIEMTKALNADAIFLDTLSSVNTLRGMLDAEGMSDVVLETEFEPSLANMDESGIQASLYVTEEADRKLELSRNKWFDRKYIEHVLKEQTNSNQDKTADIQGAFFNGNGIELIENQYQLPAMTDERSSSLLRAMLPIQRRYADMFADNSVNAWTPLIDTNDESLYGSLWSDSNSGNRLWTMVNTGEQQIFGDLLTVRHVEGQRYYDLISGEELNAIVDNGTAVLEFPVRGRGIMGVVAGTPESLGADFPAFLASQAAINQRATDSLSVPQVPEHLEPVAQTEEYAADAVPTNMVALDPVSGYPMNIAVASMRLPGQPGFQFRQRGDALPYFDTPLERTVDIPAFAIDQADVTNAQYQVFLEATNYAPTVADNFLDHWEKDSSGKPLRPVAGTEDQSVIYVSYKDALAYADWAGKRLPSQEEFTYAMQQQGDKALIWPEAPHRVWNMTSSIRSSEIARSILLKGGTSYATGTSVHYADSARDPRITNFDWVHRFEMGAEGINRQGTVGFRLAVDLAARVTPETPVVSLELVPSSVNPKVGDTITVAVEGFDADGGSLGDVTDRATLSSSVDTDIVDGTSITFTHASPHEITATVDGVTASVIVDVQGAVAVPGGGHPDGAQPGGGSLATTGSADPMPLVVLGGLLALIGAAFVLSRTRRRHHLDES